MKCQNYNRYPLKIQKSQNKKGVTALDIAKRDCRFSKNWEQIKLLVERVED